MTHKTHPQHKPKPDRPAPAVEAANEAASIEAEAGEIVERPNGFYWQALDGQGEFGPFETYELARGRRDSAGQEQLTPGETLHEAESDIGINEWMDAETGEPAEGQSPPHLEEE